MELTRDKRVAALENLITDLPEIINFRMERIDTALRKNATRFDEISGRLNLHDKQAGMLMRDMRGLRGGVTRMLVAQDEAIVRSRPMSKGLRRTLQV